MKLRESPWTGLKMLSGVREVAWESKDKWTLVLCSTIVFLINTVFLVDITRVSKRSKLNIWKNGQDVIYRKAYSFQFLCYFVVCH